MISNMTRAVATILGIVLLVSVAALVLFFTVGAPFGAINDWTIGIAGALSALLALTFDGSGRPGVDIGTKALAVVGSVLVVAGAVLVISRTTGFLLAGLIESFGFALVGIWLIVANGPPSRIGTSRLRMLGVIAGALMAIGLVTLPAIVTGVDDADTAPGYVWLGFVGWLGIFLLYPIWAIGFGRDRASGV
jgi:hypothetical protein